MYVYLFFPLCTAFACEVCTVMNNNKTSSNFCYCKGIVKNYSYISTEQKSYTKR